MKKFVSVLLVVTMAFALVACSGSSGKKASKIKNKSKVKDKESIEYTEAKESIEYTEVVNTPKYTEEDAREVIDTYYNLMINEMDFDTYYKLCYPEHLRARRTETYAKFYCEDPEDFDLEAYARGAYEEDFGFMQSMFSDISYEIYGCVVGGSEDEAFAALEKYYHDETRESDSSELEQWRQTAIDKTKGFTGGDPDNIQQIFVFASRCANFRELLVVYVYNGEFYIGSQIDRELGQ